MSTEDSKSWKPERSQTRRKRVEGGRIARHVVRVTPEEKGQLLALALQYKVTVPKLLVDSALAGGAAAAAANESVRHEVIAQMFATHRLLAGLANNVNQMAKATNATGSVQAEMVATLAKVREVADHIDRFVDELSEASS
ncbi:MobC family plasmid mobilization relaxosome protein [Leucobacter massiliensis]|uniref:Bacterial mobilisation domain-containing protein n=1 Tax=Leucobacter massiliensis TaxID=1686285 RepID=A0A2S9QSF3_9MICO|nr:MobC family plasmid mobilization relaxosome protein [Leucobacter massiliensis]PRI12502.1 hypothetical protein B4915_00895 [Leucobacter massiliensis]